MTFKSFFSKHENTKKKEIKIMFEELLAFLLFSKDYAIEN